MPFTPPSRLGNQCFNSSSLRLCNIYFLMSSKFTISSSFCAMIEISERVRKHLVVSSKYCFHRNRVNRIFKVFLCCLSCNSVEIIHANLIHLVLCRLFMNSISLKELRNAAL